MSDFILFEKALDEYKKITTDVKKNHIDEELKYDMDKNITINNKICLHINIISEGGAMICESCGKELEKNIYRDKEWRYYGQSDSKRTSDPNRVHARKIDEKIYLKMLKTWVLAIRLQL